MDLYILENQIIPLPITVDYTLSNIQSYSGTVNFHLEDKKRNESTERGVIQGNHFPWKVGRKVGRKEENVFSNKYQTSKKTDGSCGFKLELECTVTMDSTSTTSGTFLIGIKGDFVEILKYVYQTDSLPRHVKLNFQAVLTFPGSNEGVALFYGIHSTTTDCKFYNDSELSVSVVEKIIANKEVHLKALTMQLILNEMYSTIVVNWLEANVKSSTPAPRSAFENFTRKLKNIILKNKISRDFVLVSNNGAESPSHKIILAAQSPVLKRLFQKDTKINRCHLNLSGEGMKILLDFLYFLKFNKQTINSLVAAELLRISHGYQLLTLEKKVKDLVMDKPDDWLDFEASLQLYLYFNELYCYEDLMIKTMAAITMKQDEVDKSDAFKKFLETDRNAAFQFIKRAFCSKKSWIVDNLL
ncbi:unnamed protein product [Orchesella dallaii]|uniref:BTB domain-containing protein n=1 Tax=Orchesella dallaii TaxID=48710 RepID=A0ABP1R4Q8_9HEXA